MTDPSMQARLPVLTYHSIDDSGSAISTSPDRFARQMAALAAGGWRTLTLEAALAGLGAGAWPARSILLTFDDGYRSVIEAAAPVLARHGYLGTVFVITARVGSTSRWAGQPAWVPEAPLMDWGELRELAAAGWTLGAHSRTHPRLPDAAAREIEREVVAPRREIEDRCAVPVRAFAYPYGASSPAIEQLVARHYDAAFGTRLAFVTPRSRPACLDRLDAFCLRRVPFDRLDARVTRLYVLGRRIGRAVTNGGLGR